MKFFTNCSTLDELKAEYRKQAMKNHPDCGGSTEVMQEINAEHDKLFEVLKAEQNARAAEDKTGKTHATTESAEEFRTVIEKLLKMGTAVKVELCGRWLWISGATFEHKDEIKAIGCKWSANKKMWSWHHAEDGATFHKGRSKSMNEIRMKYGSVLFENRESDIAVA